MGDNFKNKLADILGKMDEKVLQARLNAAMDMLKNGNSEELAKKLSKVNKDELMQKINDFDQSKLKDMNIDVDEVKKNVSSEDLAKVSKILGEQGDEIIEKLKTLLDKK